MTAEKKAIHDDKGERESRRDKASCYYDSKAWNRFTVSLPDQLKSELSLDEAIAIAVTHKSYLNEFRSTFIECVKKRHGKMVNVSGESDPLTLIKNRTEFEKYFLEYENKLTSNVASMMNTILAFRKGLIHSSDFEDEDSLRPHLLHVVNHVLGITKKTIDNTDSTVSVDYGVVLGEVYYEAASLSYRAQNNVGCIAETNLLAKLNLNTSHMVADSLQLRISLFEVKQHLGALVLGWVTVSCCSSNSWISSATGLTSGLHVTLDLSV